MSQRHEHIHAIRQFAANVRRRINRQNLLSGLCIGALVAAAGMTSVAAGFVLAGYKVPLRWFAVPAAVGVAVVAVCYLLRRVGDERAAVHADALFDMKDGLTSALGFDHAGLSGGLTELQARQVAGKLPHADLKRLRRRPPRLIIASAVVLFATGTYLSTFADSPRIVARKADEALVERKTDEIKDVLKEAVEEIERNLPDEQKEAFAEAQIPKMIRELETTKNRTDALRQYARIEQKISKLPIRAAVKRDEKFLSELARELKKSKEMRGLARQLQQKNYSDAAKTLEKAAPSGDDNLKSMREKLERLKQIAKRADRARNSKELSRSQFSELSENLGKAGEKMESALREAEQQECDSGQCDKSTRAALCKQSDKTGESVGKMSKAMKGLGAQKKFLKDMDELRKLLGNCQGYMAGMCDKPGKGKGVGSSAAGMFVDREATEDARGLDTQVTGTKGAGPSRIAVEQADSGSGVSRVAASAARANVRTQVESLVRREDVPENLKDGVKAYFETIHETDQQDE